MESVSLTANIIRIIQLSGKLTSISYGYISNASQASKVIQDLSDELILLGKVLETLLDCISITTYLPALQKLAGKDGPLEGCARELQELGSELELKGVMDRIQWPLKEKETTQHISQIERYKLEGVENNGFNSTIVENQSGFKSGRADSERNGRILNTTGCFQLHGFALGGAMGVGTGPFSYCVDSIAHRKVIVKPSPKRNGISR